MTDFKTLIFRAGFMTFGKLNRSDICEFLLISERTLERWVANNNPCPRAVRMLESRIDGRVSNHPAWRVFRICRDGYLWTPRGLRYESSYINKIDFLQKAARHHEAHTISLQTQIENLKDLVKASDQLKSMGRELISMSDRFRFRDIMLNYEAVEKDKTA